MSNIIIPGKGGLPATGGKRVRVDEVKLANGLKVYYDYADKPVESTMSGAEYDRLINAIRYTQANLQTESYDKMNEEIPLPPRKLIV